MAETIQLPTDLDLELAYAENSVFDARQASVEGSRERNAAEKNARKLYQQEGLVKQVFQTLLEQELSIVYKEYNGSVLELFGVDTEALSVDQPETIELDDKTIEAFLALDDENRKRTTRISTEIEVLSYGRRVNNQEEFHDSSRHFVGAMEDAASKMKPGAVFVRERNGSSDSIATVAGDDPDKSAAKVVARINKERRGGRVDWRIGIIVPLVDEEEPAEFFSSAPSFNIDNHIKDLIEKQEKLLEEPVRDVHPFEVIRLAAKLEQFGKDKLVKKLRELAEQSLVSTVSGASYTIFPNGREEAPQYSPERYQEILSELYAISPETLEQAIDMRALKALEGIKWRSKDPGYRRRSDDYLNISADTYEFVRGELMFRRKLASDSRESDSTPTLIDTIDALAEFYKRGHGASKNAEEVKY
jgi:hypothetical protein